MIKIMSLLLCLAFVLSGCIVIQSPTPQLPPQGEDVPDVPPVDNPSVPGEKCPDVCEEYKLVDQSPRTYACVNVC